MESTIHQHGDHTILSLSGDVDYFNLNKLKDLIKPLTEGENKSIIVNFQEVTFIDSSGIGILIGTYKKMIRNNHQFALLNVPDDIMTILYVGTVDQFITIYNSIEEVPM